MDIEYMRLALREAERAAKLKEIPVGAVIVKDGQVIAKAHNRKEIRGCANYHAEIVAIDKACAKLGDWRLTGCDIYVTLEPCPMCAGALINARIDNIYFGAYDAKAVCCGSLYNLPKDPRFNHRAGVVGGIMEEECVRALRNFFKQQRSGRC